jgi:hypothetical protein
VRRRDAHVLAARLSPHGVVRSGKLPTDVLDERIGDGAVRMYVRRSGGGLRPDSCRGRKQRKPCNDAPDEHPTRYSCFPDACFHNRDPAFRPAHSTSL